MEVQPAAATWIDRPESLIRLYNFERSIHVDMAKHPDQLTPSYAGHSIGHWEGNTLVVDTVGFAAGVLSPPTLNQVRPELF